LASGLKTGEKMEHIVIIDEDDNYIGEEDKEKCHDGNGILHRGFLAMVINNAGELLLAQRSERKRLWPGFWDGTIASHVIEGEDYIQASKRRLLEEAGFSTDNLEYLFKFRYHVKYKNIGSENEICAVTMANNIDTDRILLNDSEISAVKTISFPLLMEDLKKNKHLYTPWLTLAVERIMIHSELCSNVCHYTARPDNPVPFSGLPNQVGQ
jgi:isopentenyl-diphosphate delta-isomerase